MKKILAALVLVPALALAAAPVQNHHCEKDGQTLEKTKKECHKDGGKWVKNASATKAATPATTAPKADTQTAPASTK